MTTETLQPHSIDSEIALIGSCIIEGDEAVNDMIEHGVKEEWFYRPAHSIIWRAMVQLVSSAQPVDEITVGDELEKMGEFTCLGGNKSLIEITNKVESGALIKRYASKVADCYYRRRVLSATAHAAAAAHDPATEIENVMAKLCTDHDTIQAERHMLQGKGIYTAKEATDLAASMLQEMIDTRGKSGKGIPTGLIDLDRIMHGLRKSEIIVIAARPGCGKTSMAMNIAQLTALSGIHTLFFSLEMPASALMMRVISSLSEIDLDKIRDGYVPADAKYKLEGAVRQASQMNMTIDDQAGSSAARIRARCKQMVRKHNTGLVVIDYLQLVTPNTKSLPREQQIAEIMNEMVAIKKECGVPVVILAQINREAEKTNRAPKLSDLRESDSIGAAADVAMFLYNELNDKEEGATPNKVWCRIDKNRNGKTGSCPLTFRKEYAKFANYIQ